MISKGRYLITLRRLAARLFRRLELTWRKLLELESVRTQSPKWRFSQLQESMSREIRTVQSSRERFSLPVEVLFVWVPKAAGTSLYRWLNREIGMQFYNHIRLVERLDHSQIASAKRLTFGHMNPDSLVHLGYLTPEELDKSFSFAVVRNPYTRAVSLWRYLRHFREIPRDWSFDTFVTNIVREDPQIGPFNFISLSQASPMVRWVFQNEWAGPRMIYHLEAIDELTFALHKAFSISSPLPSENVAVRERHPEVTASLDSLSKLQSYYADDFEAFGYSRRPPENLFSIGPER
jgi:hypothetical protein